MAHVCNSSYNGTFLFTFFGSWYLQTELALQLCWAVGEHGGGGFAHKAAARELFETLELLLYENLSSRSLFFLSPIFTWLLDWPTVHLLTFSRLAWKSTVIWSWLWELFVDRRMTTMKADLEQKDEGALIAVASQSRLLCFVVTAIAKLATCHRELSPRARVCLAKVCVVTDL